jgi:hypothetical protein
MKKALQIIASVAGVLLAVVIFYLGVITVPGQPYTNPPPSSKTNTYTSKYGYSFVMPEGWHIVKSDLAASGDEYSRLKHYENVTIGDPQTGPTTASGGTALISFSVYELPLAKDLPSEKGTTRPAPGKGLEGDGCGTSSGGKYETYAWNTSENQWQKVWQRWGVEKDSTIGCDGVPIKNGLVEPNLLVGKDIPAVLADPLNEKIIIKVSDTYALQIDVIDRTSRTGGIKSSESIQKVLGSVRISK